MDWQERLIGLYLYICDHYETHLWVHAQRLSNNDDPKFSDEEVLTLYLFGIMQKCTTIKAIYTYTQDHLHDWFPTLPTYEGYVQRFGSPEEVWNEVSELAGVDKRGFDTYYEGREIAYALQVTDVWEYENPVDLNKLRNRFSNFSVPQSWRYVKPEEYRSFRNMKREIKEEVFNG